MGKCKHYKLCKSYTARQWSITLKKYELLLHRYRTNYNVKRTSNFWISFWKFYNCTFGELNITTYHPTPPTTALAESTGASRVQACRPCLQVSAADSAIEELCQPADFEARRRLWSASSSSPVVRRTRLSTVGDRAFQVAAARIWNGLPPHVTSAPSLPVFRSRLKTHLFRRCFPFLHLLFFVVPVKWLVIIGHVNRSFYLLTYLLTDDIQVIYSCTEPEAYICSLGSVREFYLPKMPKLLVVNSRVNINT